jgi:hypothetical protein
MRMTSPTASETMSPGTGKRPVDMGNKVSGAERSAARCKAGGASIAVWLRRTVSVGALAVGLLGCIRPLPLESIALPKAIAHARQVHVTRKIELAQATRHFKTYVLYALLEPLLDVEAPDRWADPSLSFDCEAGEVTVDGAPLDVGAPVPEQSFTVRWRMQRCTPFGDSTELTGDVELTVQPSAGGYRAIVQPAQLHLASRHGHKMLVAPFVAIMSGSG